MTSEWLAKRAEIIRKLRMKLEAQPQAVPDPKPPRYDEVYEQGMQAWADLVESGEA